MMVHHASHRHRQKPRFSYQKMSICYSASYITLNLPLQKQFSSPQLPKAATSQIEGPTLRNSFGFKFSLHDLKTAKAVHEVCQGQLWDSSSQLPYGLCDICHVNSQSPHRAVPVVISNGFERLPRGDMQSPIHPHIHRCMFIACIFKYSTKWP